MFAVAGVTGHTGSVVAATLLERKQQVRVIVRTSKKGDAWKAKGAQVAVASLEDVQALTKALQGVTGAYLLVPPNYKAMEYMEDRRRVTEAMASAVGSSGLRHVVLLSSLGGQLTAKTGPVRTLHYAERRLGALAPRLRAGRPGCRHTRIVNGPAFRVKALIARGKCTQPAAPARFACQRCGLFD